MSRIPFTTRVAGRYRFRRRIHFRSLISRPLTLSLHTADPDEARTRSALLSARFQAVKRRVRSLYVLGGDFLTGQEIHDLFQAELRAELERALAPIYRSANVESTLWQTRIFAEAYDIARRLDRPSVLSDADKEALIARGVDWMEVEFIACDLHRMCSNAVLADREVADRLEQIGAFLNRDTIEAARPHILRARAEAYRRAGHVLDPTVQDAPNPVEALLGPRFDRAATTSQASAPVSPSAALIPAAATRDECQFLIRDPRRFREVIPDVVEQLRREAVWKGDCAQQRRIMETFAWITGDKPLGDYTHLDVADFKKGLMRLPVAFRFGSATAGAMSRPFAKIVAELPPLGKADERNVKTINRDLSTMSTVAKHLAQTAWKPRNPGSTVLDFASAAVKVKDKGLDLRPPWTRAHMTLLFGSSVWTGGGPAKQRLKEVDTPVVWHDAAYWCPLLWYYHQTCREEMCGLRVEEVVVDHSVPYFVIQDNDVRGRDGELAGEKRIARRRALPVHPELIRLGFLDYAEAIRREGHAALFPELYVNAAKRGGAQFYAVAWRFMVEWIEDHMEVPVNAVGKGPDIHSIRALGSSFYEVDGVNEIVRADVMGHARSGTNARHYSKRIQTEGLDTVLRERLDFIQRYVPVVTAELAPSPLRLLPLEGRSRVGSGRHRKLRSDAGHLRRPSP